MTDNLNELGAAFFKAQQQYHRGNRNDLDSLNGYVAGIAAIEPALRKRHRAELYEELIVVASNTTAFEQVTFGWLYGVADGEPLDDEGTVADWLRSRQEAEDDR